MTEFLLLVSIPLCFITFGLITILTKKSLTRGFKIISGKEAIFYGIFTLILGILLLSYFLWGYFKGFSIFDPYFKKNEEVEVIEYDEVKGKWWCEGRGLHILLNVKDYYYYIENDDIDYYDVENYIVHLKEPKLSELRARTLDLLSIYVKNNCEYIVEGERDDPNTDWEDSGVNFKYIDDYSFELTYRQDGLGKYTDSRKHPELLKLSNNVD